MNNIEYLQNQKEWYQQKLSQGYNGLYAQALNQIENELEGK